jgi:hypothetical protein
LNKGQQQFENNQRPEDMRMKCWKNLSMKKVRKVFRESWEEACEYLLMEQIVNTDGMVSFGNSTRELEDPANVAIRPVVLFPEELVTGKILTVSLKRLASVKCTDTVTYKE